MNGYGARVRDYLLAQTLRRLENAAGGALSTPDTDAQAAAFGTDFGARILRRARLVADESGSGVAVAVAGRRLAGLVTVAVVLAFLAGLGITGVFPEGWPARVNVFGLLAMILVPHALSLLLWLLSAAAGLIRPAARRRGSWLGRRLAGLFAYLERLPGVGERERAAAAAWLDFLLGTDCGARRLALAGHAVWTAALTGTLVGLWWLLVVRQVDFVWGSTLLSDTRVAALIGSLSHWVGQFGFPAPDRSQIAASRLGASGDVATLRTLWGWFLLGAVLTLAILPRAVAAGVDALRAQRAAGRLMVDLSHPDFARLAPSLMPVTRGRSVLSPDDAFTPPAPVSPDIADRGAPPKDAVWFALETAPVETIAAGPESEDLGIVSTLADEARVLEALASRRGRPVCIYADLRCSPDRGVVRFLDTVAARAPNRARLVLGTARAVPRLSQDDRTRRLADWEAAATRAGLCAVHLLED